MGGRLTIFTSIVVAVVAMPGVAAAHAVGGRLDLPVPLSFFIVGAGLAVAASFGVVAAVWPRPRLQGPGPATPIGGAWVRPLRLGLAGIGVVALFLVVATGLWHGPERTIGPALVFIYFWLVVPFAAAVAGNWWLGLSPWRTIGPMVAPNTTDVEATRDLGIWPAAALFLAFTWFELVYVNNTDPQVLAIVALAYTVLLLAVMSWLGVQRGLRHWGLMENYARLVGAISPIEWRTGRDGDVTLARRSWLRALPALPEERGLAAFVVVMIGTVTYDGMSGTGWWRRVFRDEVNDQLFGALALLGVVAAIGAAYLAASWAASRVGETELTASEVARSFAHTLVPIGLAYAVAHYVTLVVFEGQLLIHTASDPFGRGWNLFGTARWNVSFWSWLSPTIVWYVQVTAIVAGHVAGVVLAHDRALATFSSERAARSQYVMLLLMVGLTSLGLFILSG